MLKIISITLFIFTCTNGNTQTKEASNKNSWITEEQKKLISGKIALFPKNTEMSIAFIQNGTSGFYGVKRLSDSTIVLDNHNKVFEIGSITKVFTSTILADFVVKGKLKLQSKIYAHTNVPFENETNITYLQLSNHTSGLPRLPTNLKIDSVNFHNPYSKYNQEKLQEFLREELELIFPPGKRYNYSNLGAGLLGFLLEDYSNMSYENLLQSKIFSKYQMSSSTTNPNKVKDKLVIGLDKEGNETSNWDFLSLVGAGGILSTANDLSNFAVAQFDDSNKALNITRIKTFTINESLSIGLGWHIIEQENGTRFYTHNGGTGGYSSSIIVDTKNSNAIIILSNVSAFNKNAGNIAELALYLMQTLSK